MKKWKMAAVIVLCLFAATVTFNRSEVSVYAYTQDEIDAAKAWLSANGYSPTKAGAEQAYQDYLNGKWGPVGGEEETETPATTEVLPTETVVETAAVETVEDTAETDTTKKTAKKNTEASTETESEETTEETTETNTESNAEPHREAGIAGTTGPVNGENSTADMTSETGEGGSLAGSDETVSEAVSETEAESGFIRVGRFDGIIVVLAVAVCAVAGFFTYRYIKKSKKEGE